MKFTNLDRIIGINLLIVLLIPHMIAEFGTTGLNVIYHLLPVINFAGLYVYLIEEWDKIL